MTKIERILNKNCQRLQGGSEPLNLDDLASLLSQEATPYLTEMVEQAAQLTRQRFGHTMRLFVPLYLSNLCANDCSYCGFSMHNKIKRTTLTMKALAQECQILRQLGFDSVLLVAGEHESKVGMPYFRQAIAVVSKYFSHITLEVQPLSKQNYAELRQLGLAAVYVYQETYQPEAYQAHHIRGKKKDMSWRLEAPHRIAEAGIRKIGLGILLGLADWRQDALACATHLRQLQHQHWQVSYSMAFPRLQPCEGTDLKKHQTHLPSDKEFVQLLCAFRLFEPDLELSLSTRESAYLRDHLCQICITHMSAGSKTQPGGYADNTIALEQFDTTDNRSAQVISKMLEGNGLEPIWKDWQPEFS